MMNAVTATLAAIVPAAALCLVSTGAHANPAGSFVVNQSDDSIDARCYATTPAPRTVPSRTSLIFECEVAGIRPTDHPNAPEWRHTVKCAQDEIMKIVVFQAVSEDGEVSYNVDDECLATSSGTGGS